MCKCDEYGLHDAIWPWKMKKKKPKEKSSARCRWTHVHYENCHLLNFNFSNFSRAISKVLISSEHNFTATMVSLERHVNVSTVLPTVRYSVYFGCMSMNESTNELSKQSKNFVHHSHNSILCSNQSENIFSKTEFLCER